MSEAMVCPHCGGEVELTALVRVRLEGELRASLAADSERRLALALEERTVGAEQQLAARDAEVEGLRAQATATASVHEQELARVQARLSAAAADEVELRRRARALEVREAAVTADLERRVDEERQRLRVELEAATDERVARRTAEAEQRAEERHALDLGSMHATEEALREARLKLDEAAAREVALLQKESALDATRRELAVESEQRIFDETRRARDEAEAGARERQRLSDEENQQRTTSFEKTITHLQQQLRQGSQQTQGEAQEVVLRDLLERAFPDDLLEDVQKGVRGADVLQRVRDPSGHDCGAILWEIKRTRAWSKEWITKLRNDKLEAGADLAVIATQALPSEMTSFGQLEGVWVCGLAHAVAVAALLRTVLVEVAFARRTDVGRCDKEALVYRYVSSPAFRNRLDGIVSTVGSMREQLNRERTATLTSWKRRATQIDRMEESLSSVWGELVGIAGSAIGALPGLELEALEPPPVPALALAAGGDSTTDDEPTTDPGGSRADDRLLVDLLYSLVPKDGGTVGNRSLAERFCDEALTRFGVTVEEVDYLRCSGVLVDEGRLRRGRGYGGTLQRTDRAVAASGSPPHNERAPRLP